MLALSSEIIPGGDGDIIWMLEIDPRSAAYRVTAFPHVLWLQLQMGKLLSFSNYLDGAGAMAQQGRHLSFRQQTNVQSWASLRVPWACHE